MKPIIKTVSIISILLFALIACRASDAKYREENQGAMETIEKEKGLEVATFAGGCFWCTEADFEKEPGVAKVISGYTGGKEKDPTYKQVSSGATGHVEAIQVYYDPKKVTYEELLDYFWRHINPTDAGGQFVDRGSQYKSVIFYP